MEVSTFRSTNRGLWPFASGVRFYRTSPAIHQRSFPPKIYLFNRRSWRNVCSVWMQPSRKWHGVW